MICIDGDAAAWVDGSQGDDSVDDSDGRMVETLLPMIDTASRSVCPVGRHPCSLVE